MKSVARDRSHSFFFLFKDDTQCKQKLSPAAERRLIRLVESRPKLEAAGGRVSGVWSQKPLLQT